MRSPDRRGDGVIEAPRVGLGARIARSSGVPGRDPEYEIRSLRCGSKPEKLTARICFRFAPESGHRALQSGCPFRADIVAKVENRTTPKSSRKLIFGLLCRCAAFRRHNGGP